MNIDAIETETTDIVARASPSTPTHQLSLHRHGSGQADTKQLHDLASTLACNPLCPLVDVPLNSASIVVRTVNLEKVLLWVVPPLNIRMLHLTHRTATATPSTSGHRRCSQRRMAMVTQRTVHQLCHRRPIISMECLLLHRDRVDLVRMETRHDRIR